MANNEIDRRLYFAVVEDRDGLAHLDSNGDGSSAEDRFAALGAYFGRWLAGVDTGEDPENNPRYCVYLVLDSESMASLARLPEELPPLQCPVDDEEARVCFGTGDSYHGWLRSAVYRLERSWVSRLTRDSLPYFLHEERPEGSGVYYYTGL